jgi:hypothetical protein
VRLDETHDGVRRNGRIDGVAAALEDLHARTRGKRLTRGDDAVLGRDLRPAGDDACVSNAGGRREVGFLTGQTRNGQQQSRNDD